MFTAAIAFHKHIEYSVDIYKYNENADDDKK